MLNVTQKDILVVFCFDCTLSLSLELKFEVPSHNTSKNIKLVCRIATSHCSHLSVLLCSHCSILRALVVCMYLILAADGNSLYFMQFHTISFPSRQTKITGSANKMTGSAKICLSNSWKYQPPKSLSLLLDTGSFFLELQSTNIESLAVLQLPTACYLGVGWKGHMTRNLLMEHSELL